MPCSLFFLYFLSLVYTIDLLSGFGHLELGCAGGMIYFLVIFRLSFPFSRWALGFHG